MDSGSGTIIFLGPTIIFLIIAVLIAVNIGCGLGTKAINESKGYYGGFAWGFLLGIIGVMIVGFKEPASGTSGNFQTLENGGWKCPKCGTANSANDSTCSCCGYSNKPFSNENKT